MIIMKSPILLVALFVFSAWTAGCDEKAANEHGLMGSEPSSTGSDAAFLPDEYQDIGAPISAADMRVDGTDSLPADAAEMQDSLLPEEYCETTVDMFCEFYLRCDRMAAESMDDCREVFLETCNERYEPIYTALVEAGRLSLSRAGTASCRAHLRSVECDRQVFDLDDGCKDMWVGSGGEGAPCSIGIESFVCGPALSCEIGSNLCGECRTSAFLGKRCAGNADCIGDYVCIDGRCTPRGRPGDACEESRQCAVGTRCEDSVCRSFIRARLGEPCDQIRRCPYRSVCSGGVCVKTSALGESCTPNVGCMSGFCDEVCRPLKSIGTPCESAMECRHGRCTEGECGPTISACLTPSSD